MRFRNTTTEKKKIKKKLSSEHFRRVEGKGLMKGLDAAGESVGVIILIEVLRLEFLLLLQPLFDADAEGVAGDLAHIRRQRSFALPVLLLDHDVAERMDVEKLGGPMFVFLDEEGSVRQIRLILETPQIFVRRVP